MAHHLKDLVEFSLDLSRRKFVGEVRGRSYHHEQWHYDIMDSKGKLHMNVPATNVNPRGSYETTPSKLSLLQHASI